MENKIMNQKTCNRMITKIMPFFVIAGLLVGFIHTPSCQALSCRGKKAVGIIVGAGIVGATAGAAGGAKWVAPGLLGGGLTGGLIARGCKPKYDELQKDKATLEQKIQNATSESKRMHLEKKLTKVNEKIQMLEQGN